MFLQYIVLDATCSSLLFFFFTAFTLHCVQSGRSPHAEHEWSALAPESPFNYFLAVCVKTRPLWQRQQQQQTLGATPVYLHGRLRLRCCCLVP